ncbi:DMT family transporter [Chryseosolibacter indicus]|nr:DMT family transporter [Chryseosolibacter indicus]
MTRQTKENNQWFLTGMVLSMTCWGFSWASGKYLSLYGSPITISFFRFALTFISLFLILLFLKEPLKISRKGFLYLFIASGFISLYTFLFFKGLSVGKAGAGGVLVTVLNPIIAYAVILLMERRKPTRNEAIGLFIGLVAGAILLKLVTEASSIFNAGNIYFLLASLSWALLSLFTSKSSRFGAPLAFSFWMYGISMVSLFLFTGIDATLTTVSKADFTFWGNLFFSATITTSMATTFYFIATSKIGAGKASSFIFMVPFSAALGSWIFLNEVPEVHTIAGGLLGIVAVYIINKKN